MRYDGLPRLILTSCAVSALALGIGGMGLWGFGPPAWLLRAEITLFSFVALAYGFTAMRPKVAPWLWMKSVSGTVLVACGVAVMFVPPQFMASAFLIGVGTRMIWSSAHESGGRELAEVFRTSEIRVK